MFIVWNRSLHWQ